MRQFARKSSEEGRRPSKGGSAARHGETSPRQRKYREEYEDQGPPAQGMGESPSKASLGLNADSPGQRLRHIETRNIDLNPAHIGTKPTSTRIAALAKRQAASRPMTSYANTDKAATASYKRAVLKHGNHLKSNHQDAAAQLSYQTSKQGSALKKKTKDYPHDSLP